MKEKLLFIAPEIEAVVFASKTAVLSTSQPQTSGDGMEPSHEGW